MNTFLDAVTTDDVTGENGMPAHSTTGTAVLDLFFLLGTRPKPIDVERAVVKAWAENPDLTLKTLFQSRDIREGKGERDSFRVAIRLLANNFKRDIAALVPLVAEYGRWDDLHSFFGTPLQSHAIAAIFVALKAGNGLCAKWQPRKGPIAETLRIATGVSPKTYRKTLVGLTQVVESQMCARQWSEIDYNKLPSRASVIYTKAFNRHDEARYKAWRETLAAEMAKPAEERDKTVKVNTGTLYPHEVVRQAAHDSSYPFEAAWTIMQEKFPAINQNMIAVCDVSGSMRGEPMDVSVSLGLFLSQRNTGAFKDCFITFSEHPQLQQVKGTLRQRVSQIQCAQWDMNTNLEAVFKLVASAARKSKPEDVPSIVLILSDMQFDEAIDNPGANAMRMIDAEFASMGVKRPQIVFWNLRDAGAKAVPVKAHESGAALLSGFSPNMVKALLTTPSQLEGFTSYGIMLAAIDTPRYERIRRVPMNDINIDTLSPAKTRASVKKKTVKPARKVVATKKAVKKPAKSAKRTKR